MTVNRQAPQTLEDKLRPIVLANSSVDEADLRDNTSLLDIVDSLGVAEIFLFVEEHLHRPLQEHEMNRETFNTIASIAGLIRMETID
jgi:acyl carrier protein